MEFQPDGFLSAAEHGAAIGAAAVLDGGGNQKLSTTAVAPTRPMSSMNRSRGMPSRSTSPCQDHTPTSLGLERPECRGRNTSAIAVDLLPGHRFGQNFKLRKASDHTDEPPPRLE